MKDYSVVMEDIYAALEGLNLPEMLGVIEMVKYEIVINNFVDQEVH